jgi:hypothetical protein
MRAGKTRSCALSLTVDGASSRRYVLGVALTIWRLGCRNDSERVGLNESSIALAAKTLN